MQLFAHERDQVRPRWDALEPIGRLAIWPADISCVPSQTMSLKSSARIAARVRLVDALKRGKVDVGAPAAALGRHDMRHELVERHGFGVAFSQVGKHLRDVAAEYRIQGDQIHLFGAQRFALTVEQIRDALHEHRGLVRSGRCR